MCWHHNVHIVCAQWFHPLLASPRMLCVYFLIVQLGLRHHFCYTCITLSFFIICRTTNRKLNLSDLTLCSFNDKCWVHDNTQYTRSSIMVTTTLWSHAAWIREVLQGRQSRFGRPGDCRSNVFPKIASLTICLQGSRPCFVCTDPCPHERHSPDVKELQSHENEPILSVVATHSRRRCLKNKY